MNVIIRRDRARGLGSVGARGGESWGRGVFAVTAVSRERATGFRHRAAGSGSVMSTVRGDCPLWVCHVVTFGRNWAGRNLRTVGGDWAGRGPIVLGEAVLRGIALRSIVLGSAVLRSIVLWNTGTVLGNIGGGGWVGEVNITVCGDRARGLGSIGVGGRESWWRGVFVVTAVSRERATGLGHRTIGGSSIRPIVGGDRPLWVGPVVALGRNWTRRNLRTVATSGGDRAGRGPTVLGGTVLRDITLRTVAIGSIVLGSAPIIGHVVAFGRNWIGRNFRTVAAVGGDRTGRGPIVLGGTVLRNIVLRSVAVGDVTLRSVAVRSIVLRNVTVGDITLRSVAGGSIVLRSVAVGSIVLRSVAVGGIVLRNVAVGDIALRSVAARDATLRSVAARDITLRSVILGNTGAVLGNIGAVLGNIGGGGWVGLGGGETLGRQGRGRLIIAAGSRTVGNRRVLGRGNMAVGGSSVVSIMGGYRTISWNITFGGVWIRFAASRSWALGGRTRGGNWSGWRGCILARVGRVDEVKFVTAMFRGRRISHIRTGARDRDVTRGATVLGRAGATVGWNYI